MLRCPPRQWYRHVSLPHKKDWDLQEDVWKVIHSCAVFLSFSHRHMSIQQFKHHQWWSVDVNKCLASWMLRNLWIHFLLRYMTRPLDRIMQTRETSMIICDRAGSCVHICCYINNSKLCKWSTFPVRIQGKLYTYSSPFDINRSSKLRSRK